MNFDLNYLQKEIDEIKARNKRVEIDKAWETSWVRKILIAIMTYIVIVIFMLVVHFETPYVSAIIPSAAYLISMSTLHFFKDWWISKHNKSHS